ncbi:CenpB-DNA-bind-domain-containing protein [Cubamyces sp. BRFM 1775]|nr:CenpB-DNA-bind-domain-containing protein [Cubamyces sp. BRFM 1775]
MDTTQHYSGLVYHPHPPQPHSISDSAPPQPYPQGMSWQVPHHSPPNSSASAHAQMQPMMSHSQEHVEYAPPSAQQSFLSRHPTDPFSLHHPPSPSLESGPSSNQLSFESPQINGSIGPDRGLPRRRLRPLGRVQSHSELPDYPQLPEAHDHIQNSHYPPHQGSRPQTPNGPGAPEHFMQLSEQSRLSFDTSPGVFPRYAPMPYSQPQSRSTSGSATSAASNPRSASPALSVASALTSVSSSASAPPSQANAAIPPTESPSLHQKMPGKKKRLFNAMRRDICVYARDHPGMKQEDVAARYGVERSTVSKILKQKSRWLSLTEDEEVHVAKLRPSKFPDLERRLAEWVKGVSAQGTILSDALLRQKARQIGDQQGYTADKFKASSGWLENFKHRHGIRRGVFVGMGEVEREPAYGMDFSQPNPPSPAPPESFSAQSPPREDRPSTTDYDIGARQDDRGSMHQNGEVMHPQSLAMQSAWPRSDERQSGEPSSSALIYPDNQSHYSLQPGATRQAEPIVEAVMPPAEPVPIPIGPENGGNGEQVYVVPVMPEVLEESEVPEASEAEKALDKVLTYVGANHEDLDLSDADFQLLMEIKYKLFGKATGQPYDSRYAVNHARS